MNFSIEILIGIFGAFVAVATFFIGRTSTAKSEGASLESMRKDIEYMMKDIKYIRDSFEENVKDNKHSIRRVHKRIDGIEAFLREHNNYIAPPNSEDE